MWQRAHPEAFTPQILYVQAWIALGLIALAQWLTGPSAPVRELLLLPLVAASLTQPPVKTAVFAAGTALAAFLPLLYGLPHFPVVEVTVELWVWCLIAAIMVVLIKRLHLRRVDLSIAEESARHQARIDELTGLLNRRAFEEALADIVPEDKRRGRRLTLLLLDVDRFKLINDRYGHLAGDACLRAVGDALRGSVRELDRCFRWGGDEFAVLLLDSTDEETAAVGARVADRVTAIAPLPDGTAPTLGRGWAALEHGMDAESLLGAADAELLRNKASDARERGVRSLTVGRATAQHVD
jgi:diguanylate cyclase (GGDEF)-like protein